MLHELFTIKNNRIIFDQIEEKKENENEFLLSII